MTQLTSSQVAAAAAEILTGGGYREISQGASSPARVYEDPYGVVAVNIFETWAALEKGWPDAQSNLVDLISAQMTRNDPKAWEGFLVLLCTSPVGGESRDAITNLRYDTNRVRKLVATGEELETLEDVRGVLLPLLPLEVEPPSADKVGLVERLPELLATYHIEADIARVVVEAFLENSSIVERVHGHRLSR